MLLLADSCTPGPLVRALRERGFGVDWVAEWNHDPGDKAILDHANHSGRVLITRDKDFGDLVFRFHQAHCGVIRIAADMTYGRLVQVVSEVLDRHKTDLEQRRVVTIEPDRVRVSRTPPTTT